MENLIQSVQAVLSTTPERWLKLVDTIPLELIQRRPKDKEWSALECLYHLLDSEQWVFPVRVRAFLAGKDFTNFDPDSQGRKPDLAHPPAETAAEFARLRSGSLDLLAKLQLSDLARTARHSELGKVTLDQMLYEWAGHDLMHTVQAERALLQPFIAGTGPWRGYFRDHDVDRPS
jgi:hypothetical protein